MIDATSGQSDKGAIHVEEDDRLINAYLDGELDTASRLRFEKRIEDDLAFRETFESYQLAIEGLQALPKVRAPDSFVDHVHARIRERSQGRFFNGNVLFFHRFHHEIAAVAMILIMTGSYFALEKPTDQNLRNAEYQQTAPSR